MTKFIYSYNQYSEGAKLLAQTMGVKRIKHTNSRYRHRRGNQVINWGSSSMPIVDNGGSVLNLPRNVGINSNKLLFFQCQADGYAGEFARTPEWTTDQEVARSWIASGVATVARTVLSGHSAEGLFIIPGNAPPEAFVEAPLYTKYVKKISEWRVHIVGGNVIDVQKKMKKQDFEGERNTQVRNLANGYIYGREFDDLPEDVTEQAKKAFACSGLDFGAIDVVFNRSEDKAYVLEINTAPGLTGTTLTKYAEALGAL